MRVGFQKRKSLIARILLCCMAIVLVMSIQVFAENMSVNDLIGTDLGSSANTSTQTEQSSGAGGTTEQAPSVAAPSTDTGAQSSSGTSSGSANSSTGTAVAGDVYNGLANSSKVDLNNPKAAQATSGLKNIVGVIVSFICYAIVILLTLRVVLDLLYVTIPYTRGLLCKQAPNGGGMMGGMQSPGGFGGMGGGYGSTGGYGGMNSGYGGMSGGYGGMQSPGMGGQQQMQGRGIGGIQWVSNAAMQAVAMDNAPGAAFKIYSKDMLVVLIATPILLVLATNGALITLGFKFAGLITGIITKIGGSIG